MESPTLPSPLSLIPTPFSLSSVIVAFRGSVFLGCRDREYGEMFACKRYADVVRCGKADFVSTYFAMGTGNRTATSHGIALTRSFLSFFQCASECHTQIITRIRVLAQRIRGLDSRGADRF